jgi:hypothetical protein
MRNDLHAKHFQQLHQSPRKDYVLDKLQVYDEVTGHQQDYNRGKPPSTKGYGTFSSSADENF